MDSHNLSSLFPFPEKKEKQKQQRRKRENERKKENEKDRLVSRWFFRLFDFSILFCNLHSLLRSFALSLKLISWRCAPHSPYIASTLTGFVAYSLLLNETFYPSRLIQMKMWERLNIYWYWSYRFPFQMNFASNRQCTNMYGLLFFSPLISCYVCHLRKKNWLLNCRNDFIESSRKLQVIKICTWLWMLMRYDKLKKDVNSSIRFHLIRFDFAFKMEIRFTSIQKRVQRIDTYIITQSFNWNRCFCTTEGTSITRCKNTYFCTKLTFK